MRRWVKIIYFICSVIWIDFGHKVIIFIDHASAEVVVFFGSSPNAPSHFLFDQFILCWTWTQVRWTILFPFQLTVINRFVLFSNFEMIINSFLKQRNSQIRHYDSFFPRFSCMNHDHDHTGFWISMEAVTTYLL